MAKPSISATKGGAPDDAPTFEIVLDPHRLGRHHARVEPFGVAIWAVIAHLQGVNGSVTETARNYELPEEVVRAAIAYYQEDPRFIDAFLLLNREEIGALDL